MYATKGGEKREEKKKPAQPRKSQRQTNENRFFFLSILKTRDSQMIRIVKCGVTFTLKEIYI